MQHNTKRIALYFISGIILSACALLSTIQDTAVYKTAKLITLYCTNLNTNNRTYLRTLVNKELNGHTIQIKCQQTQEYTQSWLREDP